MHILHILEATAGGTRRHVIDLLVALTERGVKCSLIYSPLRNPAFEADAAFLRTVGIDTFCIPMTRGWNRKIDVAAFLSIRSVLHKSTFDVIHAHSSKAGFLGRLAAGSSRKHTVVYTPHCIALNTTLPRQERRLARWAETFLAPATGQFIAVSAQEKQILLRAKIAVPGQVHLICNGINRKQHYQSTASASAGFHIGCFGRLSHQKNQQFALRVLHQLRKHQKQTFLHLVGDGEEKSKLQALSRQWCLEDAVVWHGEVADPERLYPQCDVILQPSRWEGCPYTVLEAMAAEKPVLASTAGAMPQLLNGCGQSLKLNPMHRWIETLLCWQQNPELRANLGGMAQERVQKYFSIDKMANQTRKVYEDIIGA